MLLLILIVSYSPNCDDLNKYFSFFLIPMKNQTPQASPFATDGNGNNSFHLACLLAQSDEASRTFSVIFDAMKKLQPNVEFIQLGNNENKSPLHLASYAANVSMLVTLLLFLIKMIMFL